MKQVYVISIILTVASYSIAQRVAPGVPPQHYEAPPAYQQQQQPNYQQQQQQPNYQQQQQHPPNPNQQHYNPNQQVPVQNVDQYGNPSHHQQPPVAQQQHGGGGHHHGHHGQPQQVLHTGNLQDEKAHIAEHMEVPIDTSKMTDQELQFHYFKMHDADNNNKLDGCELIKSLIHWHAQGSKDNEHQQQVPQVEEKIFTDEELNTLIDPILQSDDLNKDGFIDYPEFIRAQQKSAAANQNKR
ncbi:CLUMA_CG009831, isoform A [Clunio marinus]|uniref:CLUMA_CG009831, isoform A n=1 Tax=Clunio marinus TaxID=568069 RepID=A0A1J1I7X5_9DIPT|nr:CLUMA_CG009831, isoform A [Clunio marinus]